MLQSALHLTHLVSNCLSIPTEFSSPAAGQENMSPPCSPDLTTLDRGFRELKENKEPSPKVKRRRSVKISSVALESAQWQSDALQILTCTNDYRSMNDFLMKKVRYAGAKHVLTLEEQLQMTTFELESSVRLGHCLCCHILDQRLGNRGQ